MIDRELCEHVFDIKPPWHIIRVDRDKDRKRVDIWVSTDSAAKGAGGWFKRTLPLATGAETGVWQHLSIGECRTYFHARLDEDRSVPWLGEKSTPFSNAMSRRLVELLSERISYRAACSLLDVDFQDVWIVKRLHDKGDLQLQETESLTHLERKANIHDTDTNATQSRVPPVEDPVWVQVINNEIEIHIRQLGLKLLISRVRTQFKNASDDETRMLRINELRKYFLKHEQFLTHEISQMRG